MSALSSLVPDVLAAYPGLHVEEPGCEELTLAGTIRLDAERDGRDRLVQDFPLKIVVTPDFPIEAPSVFVLDDTLLAGYGHRMNNGLLCLGAPGEIALFLQANSSLVRFVDEIVIGNLYAIEYSRIYGCLPDGERSHGAEGVIEAYLELFELEDVQAVLNLLECIHDKSYRGHLECPCGSGLISRNCHGPTMLRILGGSSWNAVSKDYDYILGALGQARNRDEAMRRKKALLQGLARNSLLRHHHQF